LLQSACSASGGSTGGGAETDAANDTETVADKSWGDRCDTDGDCITGLCLRNEYAPFGFCSPTCAIDGEPCEADSRGTVGGFCATFPEDFATEPRRFCLPICTTDSDCEARSALWETCKEPSYKGNVLYGAVTGIRVCQAPSQHGKPPVDTDTCSDWETSYQADFASQVNICKAYCYYLDSCKETSEHYTEDCCGYGCILRLTAEGIVDTVYDKTIKCYIDSFTSNEGNNQICSAPPKDCSGPPVDPTPEK